MHNPLQKGVSLFDQAKPIAQILSEVAALLAEAKGARKPPINTPETSSEESGEDGDEDEEEEEE
jgi:hypothetical protein